MREPILITGIPRSGTSMVAGVINISGAFVGSTAVQNKQKTNKNAMYENSRIRNNLIKPYLKNAGFDPKGQFPIPENISQLPRFDKLREKVENIMVDEGYEDGPWMYKGAKITLMWPIWAYAFPDAKWVIVRRRTGDIINSCIKTSFMNAFRSRDKQQAVGARNQREGWLWWIHQHERRFIEMKQAFGDRVKFVWPEKMLYGDYQELYDTIEWLDLDWKPKEVHEFISPKLWSPFNKRKIKGGK